MASPLVTTDWLTLASISVSVRALIALEHNRENRQISCKPLTSSFISLPFFS